MRTFKEHSKTVPLLTAIPEDIHRQALVNLRTIGGGKKSVITNLRDGYLLSTVDSKLSVVSSSHVLFYHQKDKMKIPDMPSVNVYIKKQQGLLTIDSIKVE